MTVGKEVVMDDGRSRMNTDGGTIASDHGSQGTMGDE
jgi:hypothetical protein